MNDAATNVSVDHVPVLRLGVRLVALLAPPGIAKLDNFLAASLGRACGVRDVVVLDVHDCGLGAEVLGLVHHAKLGGLDFVEVSHLGTIKSDPASTSEGAGVSLECLLRASRVKPSTQSVCFWDVRIHMHGARAHHRQ